MKRERILPTFVQIVYVAAARTVSMLLHGGWEGSGETGSGPRSCLEAMTYNASITAISAVGCARGCGGIGRRASFRY